MDIRFRNAHAIHERTIDFHSPRGDSITGPTRLTPFEVTPTLFQMRSSCKRLLPHVTWTACISKCIFHFEIRFLMGMTGRVTRRTAHFHFEMYRHIQRGAWIREPCPTAGPGALHGPSPRRRLKTLLRSRDTARVPLLVGSSAMRMPGDDEDTGMRQALECLPRGNKPASSAMS
jgi:hypothetical protein